MVKIHFVNTFDFSNKNIFVVGKPASGKTFITNQLKEYLQHTIIHTDEFLKSQKKLIAEIKTIVDNGANYLVEGSLCYSLINELSEKYLPTIIFEPQRTDEEILEVYRSERTVSNYPMALGSYYCNDILLKDFLRKNKQIKYFRYVRS
jgi:adenylate kinase family enzyme